VPGLIHDVVHVSISMLFTWCKRDDEAYGSSCMSVSMVSAGVPVYNNVTHSVAQPLRTFDIIASTHAHIRTVLEHLALELSAGCPAGEPLLVLAVHPSC
jgi:hypothetical protein